MVAIEPPKNDDDRHHQTGEKPSLKIFISSPSDVRPDRLIAQRIIEGLAREFTYHTSIKAVVWEREPLVATKHFQEGIPLPSESDIVVVILWSRLGVKLPNEKYSGPISGQTVTGTEWEFEEALASYRTRNLPDLLFYRKNTEVIADIGERTILEERLLQLDNVESFIRRWFMSANGASFSAAMHSFDDAAEFGEQLEIHLRELIRKRMAKTGALNVPDIRWHQAPFRGLLSFEYAHSAVFFGRDRARTELRNLLVRREAAGAAFILVMGASGSGKSSLVKAGLLFDLSLPGMIGRVGLCRYAVLRPSDCGSDPIRALADALLAPAALPELKDLRHTSDTLTRLLRAAPGEADVFLKQGLSQASANGYLTERAEAKIAIVVDQLEELFTMEQVTAEERSLFVNALKAIASSGSAWVIATMRSDFFDRLETLPSLADLSKDDGRYLLLHPTNAEIGQMIRRPAREAGLRFEMDANGIGLDDVIHEAAVKNKTALPLLSFLLDELWRRLGDNGLLTFQAYAAVGGLEGALGRHAENVFCSLTADVQSALAGTLRMLVTVTDNESQTASSRPALLSAFTSDPHRSDLVKALLAPQARLLVVDGIGRDAKVRIAHEALLTNWPRAHDSIQEDREDLRLRSRLESAAEVWAASAARDKASLLLHPGRPLSEADDLLRRRGQDLAPSAIEYVVASNTANRRKWLRRSGMAASTIAAAMLAIGWLSPQISDWIKYREQRQIEASRTDIRGSLIAYSTSSDGVAADGDGKHSPYLVALLGYLEDRTLDLGTLFARVSEDVRRSTHDAQTPEISSSLNGRVFLQDPPPNRKSFGLAIGASSYEHVPSLPNPTGDAAAFGEAMRKIGYDMRVVLNPKMQELKQAVADLEARIEEANGEIDTRYTPQYASLEINSYTPKKTNRLVVVYLAGQGIQADGEVFFAPIDTNPHTSADVETELINVSRMILRLQKISDVQVMIIDTCRDNPFPRPTGAASTSR